jgi:hypothetical protein
MNARKTVIEEVMPGWNGRESIIAYSIRMRKERAIAARLRIVRRIQVLALIGLPLIALAGVEAGQAIAPYFKPTPILAQIP